VNDALPDSIKDAVPRVVTDAEVCRFAEVIGLSQVAPGRCSRLFLFQLYCCAIDPNIAKLFGDPAKIDAEVRSLEGLGCSVGTKPAEPFSKLPLLGLWKKHYLLGGLGSLATNIKVGAGRKGREFRCIAKARYNPATNHLSPMAISKSIADDVINLYAERKYAQNLTGEWIVYAQHEAKNYYLCLAGHKEGDQNIFERIRQGCVDEFPFLRSQLTL
jgi:hypothetical protein